MRLKFLFMIAILLQGSAMASATIVQKLLLKNGSELEGYISVQRPGENFTFTTERAVIYLLNKDLKESIVDHEVNIKQLSPEWIKWADNNDAFEGLGDNRTLKLSDIRTAKGMAYKVRILERGAKIKYLEMNKNTYSLNWDTISVLRVEKRPKTALSGINRIYKLEDGREYEGQYVEEVPGKTLSLYRDNGVVEVFETNKVVKYAMRKINPNQDLFEQSELLDIVMLKNNTTLRGIIIEQNFNNKEPKDDYLLIQTESGSTQSVKIIDIEEYRKEVNGKYKPMYDILLKEGELVINRQMVNRVEIEEIGSLNIIPNDTCFVTIARKDLNIPVVIETRFSEREKNPTLEIVKVKPYKDKKRKKIVFMGCFSFEDIVKNNIQAVKVQTSINKTTRFEYELKDPGLYVIYDPKNKSVIPFEIK